MHQKLKIFVSISLAMLITIFSSFTIGKAIAPEAPKGNNVNLVLDSLNGNETLPKNFRKTTDLNVLKDNKSINVSGLNQLNISGSEQFSEYNLLSLIKAIGTSLPIMVVDLRQESHGFINGLPVSWIIDSKNNANEGLTREQVLVDEAKKLKSIKLNAPITFYNRPNETIVPVKVQNENQLVGSRKLFYNRITVKDGGIPTDEMVDYFIESVKAQPKNFWLHFHCKEGVGRTSMFMIMYDMMRNYKEASADDIIKRQLALANLDESAVNSFYNNGKIIFLKKFYDYCKLNGDSFNVKWSEWKKTSYVSFLLPSFPSLFHMEYSLNVTSAI